MAIVLEPWEKRIVLHDRPYDGPKAESIRVWPDQAGLAALIATAGWHDVGWQNLTGGIVALHRAIRS